MKNSDLILLLVDTSINVHGQVIGLSAETKLRVTAQIIQECIETTFNINTNLLTSKMLADILAKDQLDLYRTNLLTNLLMAQAETLSKLNKTQASLTQYKNALQLLHWQKQKASEKKHLESKNKIRELETIISTLESLTKLK